MQEKSASNMFFHNESVVLQVARWSKIISWGFVVIYGLRFISDMVTITAGGSIEFPSVMFDKILFVTSLLSTLVVGAFYFLLLQGLGQGLYLALDLFISTEEPEEAEA